MYIRAEILRDQLDKSVFKSFASLVRKWQVVGIRADP
jgi:hypothetical protein